MIRRCFHRSLIRSLSIEESKWWWDRIRLDDSNPVLGLMAFHKTSFLAVTAAWQMTPEHPIIRPYCASSMWETKWSVHGPILQKWTNILTRMSLCSYFVPVSPARCHHCTSWSCCCDSFLLHGHCTYNFQWKYKIIIFPFKVKYRGNGEYRLARLGKLLTWSWLEDG